jgi:hypothetical protein
MLVILAVVAASIVTPVKAQIRSAPVAAAQRYPFPAATPEDAYRDGLINRWQLEQYAGPLPQALQGPAVNGSRGGGSDAGGGRQ